MPTLFGITAQILIAGKPVEEYGVKLDEASRKATCYIEAVEGAQFSLRVQQNIGSSSQASFYLDGERAASRTFLMEKAFLDICEKRTSPLTKAPFQFGKIRLSDQDEVVCTDEKILRELGKLRLSMRRVQVLRKIKRPTKAPLASVEAFKVFHEKSKKGAGLTHATQLGADRVASAGATYHDTSRMWRPNSVNTSQISQAIDHSDFVTIEWSYLSRDLLEIKKLVEPVAAPRPTHDYPLRKAREALSDAAQLQAENERLRRENAALRVKRERDADDQSKNDKKVKTEVKTEPTGKKKPIIIDLD